MLDPITRLTAARFDGPQALFTEAVRLLSERPALPDDLAGLVARLRKVSADARNEFAEQWADAQYTGERPDLEPITAELAVERVEDAADAIEALAAENARLAASEPQCAEVKPLEWEHVTLTQTWQAKSIFGEYAVGFDDGWWAQLDGYANWEWNAPDDPRSYHGPDAAKAAAQADYEARILSAITMRPEAEVRAEAWAAAIEAAAVKCIPWSLACSEEISALTQPADVSAALDRIKAEAKAEGMREAARIAADHTPEKHGGAPLAAHVTGKSIELAILAAIPEVRK